MPGYRRRIGERFGFGMPRLARTSIWVHAVSVGEVQAAAPLVRALLKRHPDVPLVITTMTPTGSERVRALFGDSVVHSYVPYDLAGAVRRFFDWARPMLAIIMETELWPNLYHECGQRRVPLVLASARVSLRSVRRYRRLIPLFRDTLSHGIVIARADAGRRRALPLAGRQSRPAPTSPATSSSISSCRRRSPAAGASCAREQAQDRPVWVAASTHEGEEAGRPRRPCPDPRAPSRCAARAGAPAPRALPPGGCPARRPRHSLRDPEQRGPWPTPATRVLLGDTMGELTTFYAAADVAFVGGSLVRDRRPQPAGAGGTRPSRW